MDYLQSILCILLCTTLARPIQALEYHVQASLCDQADEEGVQTVHSAQERRLVERGETIRICLRSMGEGVISGVKSLLFSQEQRGRHSTVKAQAAVANGQAERRRSTLTCLEATDGDDALCVVETQLLDKFFRDSNTCSLEISGEAVIDDDRVKVRGDGQMPVISFSATVSLDHTLLQ